MAPHSPSQELAHKKLSPMCCSPGTGALAVAHGTLQFPDHALLYLHLRSAHGCKDGLFISPRGSSSFRCWDAQREPLHDPLQWSAAALSPMRSCRELMVAQAPQACTLGREAEAREPSMQHPWALEEQIRIELDFWTLL